MEVRKHFPKNVEGKITLPRNEFDKIENKVNELIREYLKEFPEWDIDDLMTRLYRFGNFVAAMVLMEEAEELTKQGINGDDIRNE
jgi:hypothetical protein